ncbi:MAG: hypothetical protein AAF500_05115 [Myxococcota bacterium]
MPERFRPGKKAHELPRDTLVDLYRRTVAAHGSLRRTWHTAVADAHGPEIAEQAAAGGWPRAAAGADDRVLFYDDLRFIVAATELQPAMLTIARRDQATLPEELSMGRSWFGVLSRGRAAGGSERATARKTRDASPAWVGSPGRVKGRLRGVGLQLGFAGLLAAWHKSQGNKPLPFEVEAFERKMEHDLSPKQLALLWNHAALAYMLGTDRWYTQVQKRCGDHEAQRLEKEVWLDRGAAEHDLQIGIDATGVQGGTIEALLRGFQFAPGEVGILDVEFELDGPTRGVLTHHKCPALDRFEHFDDTRLKHCCDICIAGMPLSGELLNPKIRCKPLKLPPRHDSNDIACQWEYTLSESD